EYLRTLAPRLPVVYGRNTAPAEALPPRPVDARPVEVLSVGQAIHRKGLDVVVDAFRLLPDLACNLTIVGGGPELDALRRRAEGLANVRFLGAVPSDEVREAYRAADVVALPTRFGNFDLVLVEALGSGRATIVSSAAGAVADLCVAQRNSLVVDGHDPQPWADAIRRLVVDAPLRAALGEAGRRTIAGRWTIDHAIDAMVAGLRLGVLTRTGGGARAKRRLVIVGPLPPPYHGASVSTGLLVSSETLRRRFALAHVDISDRRCGRANIGRWPDVYRAQPAPMRAWMRFTLRRVTSMGVMGESLRGLFDGLVAAERIAVVANGTPEITLPSLPRDPQQVLFFSNLRRRKGVIESVDAAIEVLREHPQARFVFVGDWESDELERDVRARARQAGDSVEFRPSATGDDRLALFACSSMLLFPPVQPEGHPRVVLEALAAGLPVITTDRGAIAETVVDGESGYVLEHPVPSELAACVLRLLRDPQLRDRMSRAARARYLERFTQEAADGAFADWIAGLPRPRASCGRRDAV
ncbi:MAG: glycosyltransferase family 4 protein, partial [Chloroflexi bacterium]|nr:glycosyltransferase family 4 protein [Chloroflexota bacterium]